MAKEAVGKGVLPTTRYRKKESKYHIKGQRKGLRNMRLTKLRRMATQSIIKSEPSSPVSTRHSAQDHSEAWSDTSSECYANSANLVSADLFYNLGEGSSILPLCHTPAHNPRNNDFAFEQYDQHFTPYPADFGLSSGQVYPDSPSFPAMDFDLPYLA